MSGKSSSHRLSERKDEEYQITIKQARMNMFDAKKNIVVEDEESNENVYYADFIKSKFHSVECAYFKEDLKNSSEKDKRCYCGESKLSHGKDYEKYNSGSQWDQSKCMKFSNTKTFGQIKFIGENVMNIKPTEFVRLSYKDNVKDVMDLLFKHWNIKIGSLCISVIGGAKNFKMRPKDKEIFSQGLVKAAQTTNALIITSGLNLGITRVVGDALQEGHTLHFDKKKHSNALCCLGISPWGYVLNREQLKKEKVDLVRYKVSHEIKTKEPVSLNSNHTHYLFIDEGRRNGFANTEAGNFRATLEKELAQGNAEQEAIPVVLVIVEGGHDVFNEASRSVKENVPLVICEGTGRASDILGEAYRVMLNVKETDTSFRHLPKVFVERLKKKLKDQKISEESKVEEAVLQIETIIQNESLITFFDIKNTESLDLAILYSLIKKMKDPKATVKSSISNQIQLCLTWNRADIAKEKIFNDEVDLNKDEWNKIWRDALRNGKHLFLDLFLLNGAKIQDYLTVVTLNDLYENFFKTDNFKHTIQIYLKGKFENGLLDVMNLLARMVGQFSSEQYKNWKSFTSQKSVTNGKINSVDDHKFRRPFQELFLWAILMENYECAKLFWERSEDSILLCLLATKILQMIDRAASFQDTERIEMILKWKDYYETMAIKVLEECYEIDRDSAAYLIERKNPMWGNLTCLELAYHANDKRFISSMVCQSSIDFTWKSGLNVAPRTKFWMHLIVHLIFLFYFSSVVLYLMKRRSITWHEVAFMSYLIAMIIDKIIQISLFKAPFVMKQFRAWWNFSGWNKADFLMMILALTAMLLRVDYQSTNTNAYVMIYRVSKTIYSIIVGYMYLKLLRYIVIHPNLGPKMVMITKMINELLLYLVIIVIILLAYGVTSQASYYPERTFDNWSILNVLDLPYWTLFGELNLEKTVYLKWCDDSVTNYSLPNDCAEHNVVIPIIYSVYIFVGNILLLNVLIAIFSHIFHHIHQNSIVVWKFNMYTVVCEYKAMPIFPTPFSLIIYIVKLFKYAHRHTCGKSISNKNRVHISKENQPERHYSVDTEKSEDNDLVDEDEVLDRWAREQLMKLESDCQLSVLNEMKTEMRKTVVWGIDHIGDRLKALSTQVAALNSTLDNSQNFGVDDKKMGLQKQYSVTEDKVFDISSTINVILDELRLLKQGADGGNRVALEDLMKMCDDTGRRVTKMKKKLASLTVDMSGAMRTMQAVIEDKSRDCQSLGTRSVVREGDVRTILNEISRLDDRVKKQMDVFGEKLESILQRIVVEH